MTAAEWARIDGAKKPPCKHQLPDGRRCCECAACHPTPEEMLAWVDNEQEP